MATRPQPRYKKGDKIGGRYQVHQVKTGGMGEVYLCLDLETIQPYALKTFQQRYLTPSAKLRAAFENEVATWVVLEKHPNIVRCFYMDILDNQPFMILEWIAGEKGIGTDLRSWLRRGPLDLRLALDFTIDICQGLLHALEKQPGLVHRDLKPENILIAQGRLAKITDFGLAKIIQEADLEVEGETDDRQSLVRKGGIVGTPLYMAPEQWRGESLDERTDIYAIGCILYEMLTGEWPFQADAWEKLRRQHLEADIPKLATQQPKFVDFDPLLANCLAKRKEERFANVNNLLQELTPIYKQQFAVLPKILPALGEFTAIDYSNRGSTFYNLQQHDKAVADFNQAIEIDPTLAKTYYSRGNIYADLQQYDDALTDYNRAIQIDPTDARAYYNRANTYKDLQQYDKALADYERAIELESTFAQAYTNRGEVYINLQRYDEALADYSRVIQLAPNYARAHYNRGRIYAQLQRYEDALADFNRAIQLDPNDPKAYNNRGNTYYELQQYTEALLDYRQAIQLDANYAKAYSNISTVLIKHRKLREALPHLERAAQLGDPQALQDEPKFKRIVGFELFEEVNSNEEMERVIADYPFLVEADFIVIIEQAITQQVPQEHRPALEQRLAWLKQIAQERTQ